MSEGVGKGEGREGTAKLLLGKISCVVGLLFGAGGILFALPGASVNVSAGAVVAELGVLGYFLGVRRLGETIVLGVVAVFFMVAASTGLIPRVGPFGLGYNQYRDATR